MHQVVVVGGGAGGLELATRLGNRLGRARRAAITLVDRDRTHVWKPLLHEIAAGSMDLHQHQLDYLAQARWHGFTFCHGALEGLDRGRREIVVGPILDARGAEVIPRRTLRYDTLVLALGSTANSYGVPGVAEHALKLASVEDARAVRRGILEQFARAEIPGVKPAFGVQQGSDTRIAPISGGYIIAAHQYFAYR